MYTTVKTVISCQPGTELCICTNNNKEFISLTLLFQQTP